MKHFYKAFLAAGMIFASSTANANVEFNLTIDHPDYVKVSVNWNEVEVSEGTNHFSLGDYDNFSIDARDYQKHILQEVLVNGENMLSGTGFYRNQYNITEINGTEIEVKSCLIDDLRTGEFSLTVDNPPRLSYVSTDGTPSTMVNVNNLVAGEPYTVKYIPGTNGIIRFNASGAPIYKITKDGNIQEPDDYGNYAISIENGMNLEVFCDYPDVMANLTFNYLNDAAEMFESLYIYGDASTGYSHTDVEVIDNHAQVPLGSQIVIVHKPDYCNYVIDNYTVGSKSFSSVYSTVQTYIVNENVDITIDAHLSDPVNVTFEVEGAEGIVVNRKENTDIIPLAEGNNNVTLYSTNLDLSIKSYPSYEISSVKLNDVDCEKGWDGSYRFYSYNDMIHDGDVIKITAAPKDTYKVYLNVEDASLIKLRRNYSSWSEETVELHDGRNEIICCEGNNDFYITPSPTGYISSVNLNFDEEVEREYYGGFRFNVDADYEIMVTAEPVVNEGDLILYVDDLKVKDLSSFSWSNNLARDNDSSIVSGYNTLGFFHGFNPYKVSAYYVYGTDVTFALYLNDERIEISNPSYPSADLNLAPGDVVKIYLGDGNPEFYDVTFSDSTQEASFGNITYDVLRDLENSSESLSVLKGTRFDISVAATASENEDDCKYKMFANDSEIKPDENGIYHVEIFGNTDIRLTDGSPVSVDLTYGEDAMESYYTIDGVRLEKRPTSAGIYLCVKNNKTEKIVIR